MSYFVQKIYFDKTLPLNVLELFKYLNFRAKNLDFSSLMQKTPKNPMEKSHEKNPLKNPLEKYLEKISLEKFP